MTAHRLRSHTPLLLPTISRIPCPLILPRSPSSSPSHPLPPPPSIAQHTASPLPHAWHVIPLHLPPCTAPAMTTAAMATAAAPTAATSAPVETPTAAPFAPATDGLGGGGSGAVVSMVDELCFPSVGMGGAAALRGAKVTIVGCGSVGMACASSILATGLASTLVFADVDSKKMRGEVLDFTHGGAVRVVRGRVSFELYFFFFFFSFALSRGAGRGGLQPFLRCALEDADEALRGWCVTLGWSLFLQCPHPGGRS